MIVVPLLLYVVYPPGIESSPDAPHLAREKSDSVGPMSKNEIIMGVGLRVSGGVLKVDAVKTTTLRLSVLLITGVITWKECLVESVAWDTVTLFAALIAMVGCLNKYGLISWFSENVVK
ncbi:Dicarboxylate transporter 1 chloroplastic, partial [Bienertia sinuspersici]